MAGIYSPAFADKVARITAISSCSLMDNSFNSLFRFTTAIGSMKRVEPLEDWSCTIPVIWDLASAFTGRQ